MTLLESLIAFVILALVSVSVVAVSSQSTTDIGALKNHYYAGLVADNELILAQLKYPTLKRPISGSSTLLGKQWFWQITTKSTELGYLQQWNIAVSAQSDKPAIINRIMYVKTSKK